MEFRLLETQLTMLPDPALKGRLGKSVSVVLMKRTSSAVAFVPEPALRRHNPMVVDPALTFMPRNRQSVTPPAKICSICSLVRDESSPPEPFRTLPPTTIENGTLTTGFVLTPASVTVPVAPPPVWWKEDACTSEAPQWTDRKSVV